MPRVPPELCARCKGYKRLCGLPRCPILESFHGQLKATMSIKGKTVEGSTPPGALVGERGYPKVNLYYLLPPGIQGERARFYEDPIGWAQERVPLARIISLRSSMIAARIVADAKDPRSLYNREYILALVSERPTDTDAYLRKPPVPRIRFSGITKPIGPIATVEKLKVSSNPRLPKPLEKLLWDDVKAWEGVWEAYKKGLDIYSIQRGFSLGMIGQLKNRRLVPTRWSITAVDEILSSHFRRELLVYESISQVEVYHHEYLGNRFTIVLIPGEGSIEWIEAWHPNTIWTRQARDPIIYRVYEDPKGRKTLEDGGFSASKNAVLEYLYNRKRTSNIVIIREILPSYYAPVGNWHIREATRHALEKGPIATATTTSEVRDIIENLLVTNPSIIFAYTLLLGYKKRMSKLTDFFKI